MTHTITCYGCQLPLPEERFAPSVWATGRGRCKLCQKKVSAASYAANREERIARMTEYRMEKAFGLSMADYERMLADQDGRCAICGATEGWYHVQAGRGRKLSVDHCHERGQVRGLLCDSCNMGIGRFKHDPDLLQKAIAYLGKAS